MLGSVRTAAAVELPPIDCQITLPVDTTGAAIVRCSSVSLLALPSLAQRTPTASSSPPSTAAAAAVLLSPLLPLIASYREKMSVKLETTHGAITIKLFCKETPRTCRNFIELAKHGYYDGIIFHVSRMAEAETAEYMIDDAIMRG